MQALVPFEQYLKHNSETDGTPVQSCQNWSDMIKFARLNYQCCRNVLNRLKPFPKIFGEAIESEFQ